jgi:nucleotide-binding universal stress UspA family protein
MVSAQQVGIRKLEMFYKILVAHDGSESADRALDLAIEMAAQLESELHMVSVEEDLPEYARTMGDVVDRKQVEDAHFLQLGEAGRQRALARGVELQQAIVVGHPVGKISIFAEEGGFDLLIMGFHGHSKIYEHLWGGTSQNLARFAPCSVLVVK